MSYTPSKPHPMRGVDVYEPPYDAGKRRAAILAIHGGAWRSRDKRSFGEGVAERFCPKGYVVLSIDYRLSTEARWPAQIEDCQGAWRWVRDNARALEINPSTVAAFGVSAGGHLAAMLHLRGPDRIPLAISASGEGDLLNLRDQDRHLELLLGPGPWSPELLADVSPASWARSDARILLIHSTGDHDVSYEHSVRFNQALTQAGANDVSFLTVQRDCHGSCWKNEAGNMERWLRARQGNPRSPSAFTAGAQRSARLAGGTK